MGDLVFASRCPAPPSTEPPSLLGTRTGSRPPQVVQHWITVYPKDLNTAVTLTTANLRDGWSQKEWVRTKKPLLALIQLQHLNGEVLSEEITGIQAIVMVNAHISTIVGEQMQRERYRLLRVNGQWLIDDVTVVAERFLGKVM